MIFAPPTLRDEDLRAIELIDDLREQLRFYIVQPRRWFGTLRRVTLARAVQGSNSIEGYHASVQDVAALMVDEPALEASEETAQAISGYRDAMTYVLALGASPVRIDATLIKALHFMMLKHDLAKRPGQWREGGIWVEDQDGHTVYQAPDAEDIDSLVAELVDQLDGADGSAMVRAAMAHLNLVMIHPFSDGNGRMARCLQSLVLASDGVTGPEFASIEEYLGRNTGDYYAVLAEVGAGRWSPQRDARPWLRFCLTAHYRQGMTVLRRVRETEALWDACEQMVIARGLPVRAVGALCDAARGQRLYRGLYVKLTIDSTGETVSDAMATRDLKLLADGHMLVAAGEKRGRTYQGTPELHAVWSSIRSQRAAGLPDADPYPTSSQPALPGLG